MGADILIHRCTLRIARRGGWSWGADPRGLLNAALQRLPELIAARLGELWPAQVERQVTAPLRLRIALRLDELLALGGEAAGSARSAAATEGSLARRIDQMLQDLVLRETGAVAVEQRVIDAAYEVAAAPASEPQPRWPGSVLSVLLGWQRQGALQAQLLSFSPESLASWHQSLFRGPSGPAPPPDTSIRIGVLDLAAQVAAMPLLVPAGHIASLIRRISLVVSAAQRFGVSPGDSLLAEALCAQSVFGMPMDEAPGMLPANDISHQARPADALLFGDAAVPPPPPAAAEWRVPAHPETRQQFDTNVVSAIQRFEMPPSGSFLAKTPPAQPAFDTPMSAAPGITPADDMPRQVQAADAQQHDKAGAPPPRPAFEASPQRPVATPARVPVGHEARSHFDIKVASVLPFLLLGPLSRTGYLQTLSAVFEAAQLLPELPCFAVALARKVLEPPQRGWFRSADAVTAAAAFAGDSVSPPDAQIGDLARRIASQVSPLDAVVANVLTEGHTRGHPLLLQAALLNGQAGWILYEEEGLFPIAWAERIERLYPQLAALGGELLLVPEAALSTDLLDRLDDAGFRFITDASPARGRSWRALHKGPLRAWSNDHHGSAGPLQSAAERLESGASTSRALWLALTAERPGLPVGSEAGVERSLALAAALALGMIGWTLWREREAVTPLLALQRFADFDARVSYRPDRVQVHLPLGRRFMDLKQGGLLEDIADVPWLGGRPLRFAQG